MTRHRSGATLFLVAAASSFLLSIALWFTDNREQGIFVGLWVRLRERRAVGVVAEGVANPRASVGVVAPTRGRARRASPLS
jgi:hypothetical protein